MSYRMFIHGLESSSRGTKAVFFREKYPGMITPDFTGPLDDRMDKLRGILCDQEDIILVGSSFGGLMASMFALEGEERLKRMILLAPAINLTAFTSYREKRTAMPVWIYHGRQDDVIDIREVKKAAAEVFLNLRFFEIEDDHYLHRTFETIPWEELLSEEPCRGSSDLGQIR